MNKQELIQSVSLKAEGITKKSIEAILSAFVEVVMETVAKDEKVALTGFGSFERRDTKATSGVMNGKEWSKEAGVKPVFKVGKEFKDLIKNSVK